MSADAPDLAGLFGLFGLFVCASAAAPAPPVRQREGAIMSRDPLAPPPALAAPVQIPEALVGVGVRAERVHPDPSELHVHPGQGPVALPAGHGRQADHR